VRPALHVEFCGGTYAHLFYVADVEASGPPMNGELHGALDDADFLACFPLKAGSHARLIGTVRREAEREGEKLDWSDVNKRVIERIRLDVTRVNWFSTYHVHHRVASRFRVGRVFLLGDAAHIHSPVGGQGMNTGIGDAVNLAWKLAATLRGHADAQILDSYEEERVPFARRLVRTTDRVFEFVSATGPIANWVRIDVAPRLLTTLFQSASVRRLMFDTISQTKLRYRHARLNKGRAGRVHGGDRLPWVTYEDGSDNFELLASLGWQAHVYGDAPAALGKVCEARNLPLYVLPWGARARRAGLARDAVYLVRPDGYVGLATAPSSISSGTSRCAASASKVAGAKRLARSPRRLRLTASNWAGHWVRAVGRGGSLTQPRATSTCGAALRPAVRRERLQVLPGAARRDEPSAHPRGGEEGQVGDVTPMRKPGGNASATVGSHPSANRHSWDGDASRWPSRIAASTAPLPLGMTTPAIGVRLVAPSSGAKTGPAGRASTRGSAVPATMITVAAEEEDLAAGL
jgi:hypothetical protein